MIFVNKTIKSYGGNEIMVETYIKFSSKRKLTSMINIEDYLTIKKII